MNHKRDMVDRYIDQDLPSAIEKAVREEAIEREPERVRIFTKIRDQMIVLATSHGELKPKYGNGRWSREKFARRHILCRMTKGGTSRVCWRVASDGVADPIKGSIAALDGFDLI